MKTSPPPSNCPVTTLRVARRHHTPMPRGYPRLGGFGGQRLYRSASHRYKWRLSTANLVELHLTPLLDAFNASDPLPTTLTTPRDPYELNLRILTTTDYVELLRPLAERHGSLHLTLRTDRVCGSLGRHCTNHSSETLNQVLNRI